MNSNTEFQEAVTKILRAVMFENWLRFYFIVEENPELEGGCKENVGESLRVELPEKTMLKIKELYPDLHPLAEKMNGHEVDFESSRKGVLTYVLDYLDGKKMQRGMAQIVFASSTFQIKLQLFHTWVQIHEDQLDRGFMEFGMWLKLFDEWKNTEGAKSLAIQLAQSLNQDNGEVEKNS